MPTFIRPIAGSPPISDDYSEHLARRSVNPGTDYAVAKGAAIRAPADGVVKIADQNSNGAGGRVIVVYFDNGWSADFLHLSSLSVRTGFRVAQGEIIGYTGGSANGKENGVGAHLHFSLRSIQSVTLSGRGNVDPELHFGEPTKPAGTGGTKPTSNTPNIPSTATPAKVGLMPPVILFGDKTGQAFPYMFNPYTGKRTSLSIHQLSVYRQSPTPPQERTIGQAGFDLIPKEAGSQ